MWKPLLRNTDKMKWLNLILLINHNQIWYKEYEVNLIDMMTEFLSHPILHGKLILQAEFIG